MLLLLAGLGSAHAQSSLGIDSTSYAYNDTVNFNSIELYLVNVVNYGPQPYTGQIIVNYAVDSATTGLSLTVLDSSILNVTNLGTGALYPDSILLPINQNFRSGINTVVIWPRAGAFITQDSLKIPVVVMGFAGIATPVLHLPPDLFPNPARQVVYIRAKGPGLVFEQVRLLTPAGTLVWEKPFQGSVNVAELPAGAYLLELLTSAGQVSRARIIKD